MSIFKTCSSKSCPCISCPQILSKKLSLKRKLEKYLTDPVNSHLIATSFPLLKFDLEYIYSLIEQDVTPGATYAT
jgi:hypothetical protein